MRRKTLLLLCLCLLFLLTAGCAAGGRTGEPAGDPPTPSPVESAAAPADSGPRDQADFTESVPTDAPAPSEASGEGAAVPADSGPRDEADFTESAPTDAPAPADASGEAMLTVTCGGETIEPYPAFLWAESWTEFGWLNADGVPLEDTVQKHLEEIPLLTQETPGELSVSPGRDVHYSGRMDVYDEDMNWLFRQWEEDPGVLTALEPGAYLCALRISVTGDYIASEEQYEKTGYQCLFRLLIPEGPGQS